MSNLKNNLINLWRLSTGPYRKLRMRRMAGAGNVPIFVLFYHRIAECHPNPWSMTFDEFRRQVDWFRADFDVVDLSECQRRIQAGENHRPTISITFDDGYAENCEQALPYLIEQNIPTTYFVTTDHTKTGQHFDHDLKRNQPLPVNTIDSLRSLSRAGIEIGAHTRTHFDLGSTNDAQVIYDEVVVATRELETLVEQKIRYFAFPYGQVENLNADVFQLLRQSGIEGVCSAYGGINAVPGDAFHLQRLHGDPNFDRMRNWLQYDPRQDLVKRFDYSVSQCSIDWKAWQAEQEPSEKSAQHSSDRDESSSRNNSTNNVFESTSE